MSKPKTMANRDNKRAERKRYKDLGLVHYSRYYEPSLFEAMDRYYKHLKACR